LIKFLCQVGGGNGYPVFEMSGQVDKYWHMAQISLDSEYTAQPFKVRIMFGSFILSNIQFIKSIMTLSISLFNVNKGLLVCGLNKCYKKII
jgi:hypothetical protein